MSTLGKDLVKSLGEALAHAKGEGPATVHRASLRARFRLHANLTQAEMAPVMEMKLSATARGSRARAPSAKPRRNLVRATQRARC